MAKPLAFLLIAAGTLAAASASDAKPGRHHRHGAVSPDSERVLTRMARRDRVSLWPVWEEDTPLTRRFAPASRERVAAPPFTGWGYGATVPGAWPEF